MTQSISNYGSGGFSEDESTGNQDTNNEKEKPEEETTYQQEETFGPKDIVIAKMKEQLRSMKKLLIREREFAVERENLISKYEDAKDAARQDVLEQLAKMKYLLTDISNHRSSTNRETLDLGVNADEIFLNSSLPFIP